ncbi:MAG: tetratricopeptide repeat protein [Myxococcota bacterium]
MDLSGDGRDDDALRLYEQVLSLDPTRSTTLYNMGLVHKYRRNWESSLFYNMKAHELAPGDEAARWNLAIAATALHRWDLARATWRKCGIQLDGGDGPIEMNLGMTPVRLNPDDKGEVVWATRIDPVRARIANIPFPESGFRAHDVVLHDGAPVGTRNRDGREYPVFNVLELFARSRLSTYVATVHAASVTRIEEATRIAALRDILIEDWTGSVRIICRACSEGTPHEDHRPDQTSDWTTERRVGISASSQTQVEELLAELRHEALIDVVQFSMALQA